VAPELLPPLQKTVSIVARANVFLPMASTVRCPANWPKVASLHRKQLIA
jgi:hypothetical protein